MLIFVSTGTCERARILLHFQQYRCVSEPSSVRQYLQYHYLCIKSSTMRCIEDQVTNPLLSNGNYFCGLIDSKRIEKVPTTWAINGYPTITLDFLVFSMRHSNWRCTWDKLLVRHLSKIIFRFCGKRLPWKQYLQLPKITLVFESKSFRPGKHLFILQYYSSNRYEGQNDILILPDNTKPHRRPITIEQALITCFQYHLIVSKLDRIRVEIMEDCWHAEVVCYDGPGSRSNILSNENYTIVSSFYQTLCLFTSSFNLITMKDIFAVNASCFIFSHLPAKFDELINVTYNDEHPPNIDFEWSPIQYILNPDPKSYMHHIRKNSYQDVVALQVFIFDFSDSFILYESESCTYGGLFLIGWTETEMKELWALCGGNIPALGTISFFVQNMAAFTVLIIPFQGYSLTDKDILVWTEITLLYGSLINVDKELLSEATVTTMQNSYTFQSLGITNQRLKIHTLVFNTNYHTMGYILFNLFDDGVLKSKCVTCYASFYRIITNFVPNLKEPIKIIPNIENGFFGSMIKQVTVDESDCQLPVMWSVKVDATKGQRDNLQTDHQINTATNIILSQEYESLRVIFDSDVEDKHWWYVVHLQESYLLTKSNHSWQLQIEAHEYVSDIFLEKLLRNNTMSMVYRWKGDRVKHVSSMQFVRYDFIRIKRCISCNIIVKGYKGIKLQGQPTLELKILPNDAYKQQKDETHINSLLSNQIQFYKFRYCNTQFVLYFHLFSKQLKSILHLHPTN